jgi:hypothetical protein
MKAMIANPPKSGAFIDQKKQANKDFCREIPETLEEAFDFYEDGDTGLL